MSKNFILTFSAGKLPSLTRAEFSCKLAGVRCVSVRGDMSGPLEATGTFKWTKAVKALCSLVVRSKLFHEHSDEFTPHISGGRGSNAISLEYAISKQPLWLVEMFGTDARGEPLIKRLVQRYNGDLRLGSEIRLGLNTSYIGTTNIKIFQDEIPITSQSELVYLLERIEQDVRDGLELNLGRPECGRSHQKLSESIETEISIDEHLEKLCIGWVESEVDISLFGTEIFTNSARKSMLREYQKDETLHHFAGSKLTRFEEFLGPLALEDRLALQFLNRDSQFTPPKDVLPPIQLHTTVAQAGTLAVFYYLKDVLGLDIKIHLGGAHTPDLLRKVSSGSLSGDLNLVTLALGATIVGLDQPKEALLPVMITPGVSYRVISRLNGENPDLSELKGDFLVFKDVMSTSFYYYNFLKSRAKIKSSMVKERNLEPDEIVREIFSNEERTNAILWFPHYHITQLLTNSKTIFSFGDSNCIRETFLFGIPNGILTSEQVKLVKLCIHHAWIDLRLNAQLRKQVAKRIVTSNNYLSYLLRLTGAHAFMPTMKKNLSNYSNSSGTSCPSRIAS